MSLLDGFVNGKEQAKRLEDILRFEGELDGLFLKKETELGDACDADTIDKKIELKKKWYDFKKICWEMENARLNRSLAEFAALFSAAGFLIPYWTYNVSVIQKNDPNVNHWLAIGVTILAVITGACYIYKFVKLHNIVAKLARFTKKKEQPADQKNIST
ncbi:MAG: hypothetical protein ABF572_13290 [Gluconobacter sp.]|uniref:hypothetical protein n=1 Tax=Gluconobacter sp. TaxID=1876758 RepID=UPI0039ED8A47